MPSTNGTVWLVPGPERNGGFRSTDPAVLTIEAPPLRELKESLSIDDVSNSLVGPFSPSGLRPSAFRLSRRPFLSANIATLTTEKRGGWWSGPQSPGANADWSLECRPQIRVADGIVRGKGPTTFLAHSTSAMSRAAVIDGLAQGVGQEVEFRIDKALYSRRRQVNVVGCTNQCPV